MHCCECHLSVVCFPIHADMRGLCDGIHRRRDCTDDGRTIYTTNCSSGYSTIFVNFIVIFFYLSPTLYWWLLRTGAWYKYRRSSAGARHVWSGTCSRCWPLLATCGQCVVQLAEHWWQQYQGVRPTTTTRPVSLLHGVAPRGPAPRDGSTRSRSTGGASRGAASRGGRGSFFVLTHAQY